MSETTKRKTDVISIVEIAVCTALLAVCSWITVPYFNVPFTMQTFGVFFLLRFLGGKKGTIAIAVYILLGLIGVPVFAGFASGFTAILSYTGGYIIGFLFMGLLWWATEKARKKSWLDYFVMAGALAICYLFGTLWFMVYTDTCSWGGFGSALMMCVVPFLPFDAAKLWLAVFVSGRVKKAVGGRFSSSPDEEKDEIIE